MKILIIEFLACLFSHLVLPSSPLSASHVDFAIVGFDFAIVEREPEHLLALRPVEREREVAASARP